jgi:hypothetical protein
VIGRDRSDTIVWEQDCVIEIAKVNARARRGDSGRHVDIPLGPAPKSQVRRLRKGGLDAPMGRGAIVGGIYSLGKDRGERNESITVSHQGGHRLS